jgi:hypothetical protein
VAFYRKGKCNGSSKCRFFAALRMERECSEWKEKFSEWKEK